ncbi:hypothetical protein LINGRAHAP2_LOCUS2910 [Linum grandiflorum]
MIPLVSALSFLQFLSVILTPAHALIPYNRMIKYLEVYFDTLVLCQLLHV